MKKIMLSLLFIIPLTLITGCSAEQVSGYQFQERTVSLEDGREVMCIFDKVNGGISCNWTELSQGVNNE